MTLVRDQRSDRAARLGQRSGLLPGTVATRTRLSSPQGSTPGGSATVAAQRQAHRLLKAFDGITLYRLSDGNTTWYEVTLLSARQRRILGLVGMPESVYTRLGEPLLTSP